MHAHVGGDAADQQVADAARRQKALKVGRVEGRKSRFVDDGLAGSGRQFRNDLPSRLTPHQKTPEGAGAADLGAYEPRSEALLRREVAEIFAVPFPRMDDKAAPVAYRVAQLSDAWYQLLGRADVIAHRADIATDVTEIPLH